MPLARDRTQRAEGWLLQNELDVCFQGELLRLRVVNGPLGRAAPPAEPEPHLPVGGSEPRVLVKGKTGGGDRNGIGRRAGRGLRKARQGTSEFHLPLAGDYQRTRGWIVFAFLALDAVAPLPLFPVQEDGNAVEDNLFFEVGDLLGLDGVESIVPQGLGGRKGM